jgi:predicted DNA-binding transcriptional regulator YafY
MSSRLSEKSSVTVERASRLAKLLKLTASKTPKTRDDLILRLKVNVRGFYRDVKLIRECGVQLSAEKDKYHLTEDLSSAQGKLPCPDLGLSVSDLQSIARGSSDTHKRIQRLLLDILGDGGKK